MADNSNGTRMICWADQGHGNYTQSGATVPRLPAGIYEFDTNMFGAVTAQTMPLPDEPTLALGGPMEAAIREIRDFWGARERYAALGLGYKRGVLLAGPHGTGKSATVRAACRAAVGLGGLVSLTPSLNDLTRALKMFVGHECDRLILVVLEDIERYFPHAEEEFLELTDGETSLPPGVLFLATTNKLERIPDRVKERRSRIDAVIEFGMPRAQERLEYLRALVPDADPAWLEAVVEATKGLPMADIKEVMIQSRVFGRDPATAAARLRPREKARPSAAPNGAPAPAAQADVFAAVVACTSGRSFGS